MELTEGGYATRREAKEAYAEVVCAIEHATDLDELRMVKVYLAPVIIQLRDTRDAHGFNWYEELGIMFKERKKVLEYERY